MLETRQIFLGTNREDTMKNKELDEFGEVLITAVRDTTINQWEKILSGRMKGERAKRIFNDFTNDFNQDQLEKITDLVSQIVDSTLHYTLFMVEQEESIVVALKREDSSLIDLNQISDGLAGELYTDDGWIRKYSAKPYIEPK